MKIHNIRFGFATNSSSSHSIIFDPVNYNNYTDDYDDVDFGWDFFTLKTKQAKDEYMRDMLIQNLDHDNFSEIMIDLILKGLNLKERKPDHYGIDHQSIFYMPRGFGSNQISMEFFNDFRNYILKDGIVILGGNDNVDSEDSEGDYNGHPLYDETKVVNFNGYNPEGRNWFCRKDGSWWTLYDRVTGNRIVLSFDDNPEQFAPKNPMLIDFKITDWCDKNCSFCYQGSTTRGEHMNENDEYAFVENIARAQVFEVAIGGGEPTKYPGFIHFVKMLADRGIVVNFTTRSMEWLENEKMADDIMSNIGAFAFSVDDLTPDLSRILTIMKYRGYDLEKFNVQVVPATMNEFALTRILKWCGENYIRVTLLGFKETGRGARFKEIAINRSYNKFDEKYFIEVIKELNKNHSCPRIAIDTTLAGRYEHLLEEEKIPRYLYHIEEGKYSAYIDAVTKKFGPSSYHTNKLIDYNLKYGLNVIAEHFVLIEAV